LINGGLKSKCYGAHLVSAKAGNKGGLSIFPWNRSLENVFAGSQLNFKGLVFTDALNMWAGVSNFAKEGEVRASASGWEVDILLMPHWMLLRLSPNLRSL